MLRFVFSLILCYNAFHNAAHPVKQTATILLVEPCAFLVRTQPRGVQGSAERVGELSFQAAEHQLRSKRSDLHLAAFGLGNTILLPTL